jgi:hypothetical protein
MNVKSTGKTGKAKFVADTRGKTERRKGEDRRDDVRFEQSRRSVTDRRPRKAWSDGNNK